MSRENFSIHLIVDFNFLFNLFLRCGCILLGAKASVSETFSEVILCPPLRKKNIKPNHRRGHRAHPGARHTVMLCRPAPSPPTMPLHHRAAPAASPRVRYRCILLFTPALSVASAAHTRTTVACAVLGSMPLCRMDGCRSHAGGATTELVPSNRCPLLPAGSAHGVSQIQPCLRRRRRRWRRRAHTTGGGDYTRVRK